MPPFRLGIRVPLDDGLLKIGPAVFYEGAVAAHKKTPWLTDWIKQREGIDVDPQINDEPEPFYVEGDNFSMHALFVGATGSGKSRLALHALRELMRQGCSAVVMDTQDETILDAVSCAREAGCQDVQALVLPSDYHRPAPCWNVLLGGHPVEQTGVFVDSLRAIMAGEWGTRLDYVLRNACPVAASQGLSFREVYRMLNSPEYLRGLLLTARETGAWDKAPEQHEMMWEDYLELTPAARREWSAPIVSRLNKILGNEYLRGLLCSPTNDLSFSSLWERQQLVGIHLDRLRLQEDGVTLLAALTIRSLFTAALRKPGNRPVVLLLDEMDTHERAVGTQLLEVIRRSRKLNLRLIAATQTLNSVTPALVSEFLGNAYFNAYFNLSHPHDARQVASWLTDGVKEQVSRVAVTDSKNITPATMEYRITDAYGNGIHLGEDAWKVAHEFPAHAAITSLLKRGGVTGYLEGTTYPLSEAMILAIPNSWSSYLSGDPLTVRLSFPRPDVEKLTKESSSDIASNISNLLQYLPERHAIVRTRGGGVSLIVAAHTQFTYPLLLSPPDRDIAEEKQSALQHRDEMVLKGTLPDTEAPTVKGRAKKPVTPPPITYPTFTPPDPDDDF